MISRRRENENETSHAQEPENDARGDEAAANDRTDQETRVSEQDHDHHLFIVRAINQACPIRGQLVPTDRFTIQPAPDRNERHHAKRDRAQVRRHRRDPAGRAKLGQRIQHGHPGNDQISRPAIPLDEKPRQRGQQDIHRKTHEKSEKNLIPPGQVVHHKIDQDARRPGKVHLPGPVPDFGGRYASRQVDIDEIVAAQPCEIHDNRECQTDRNKNQPIIQKPTLNSRFHR